MSEINRLKILEQRFKDDALTDIEQDELFELLERHNRLDAWLDDGIQLMPSEEIVYDDKDFLKSIAEPIEPLIVDKSIVYENKESLRRKRGIYYFVRRVELRIAVAAAVIVMLFTSNVFKQSSFVFYEDKSSVAVLEKESLNLEEITDVKAPHYHIEIKKISDNNLDKYLALDEDLSSLFDLIDIQDAVKMKDILNSNEALNHNETLNHNEALNHNEIGEVNETLNRNEILKVNEGRVELKKPVEELVLFAQAEQWDEVIVDSYQEEIIIDNEEWKSSKERPRRKVRDLFKRSKSI